MQREIRLNIYMTGYVVWSWHPQYIHILDGVYSIWSWPPLYIHILDRLYSMKLTSSIHTNICNCRQLTSFIYIYICIYICMKLTSSNTPQFLKLCKWPRFVASGQILAVNQLNLKFTLLRNFLNKVWKNNFWQKTWFMTSNFSLQT